MLVHHEESAHESKYIWIYTAKNWTIEQADTYHRNLVATFEGLAMGAKRGRPADVLPKFQKDLSAVSPSGETCAARIWSILSSVLID